MKERAYLLGPNESMLGIVSEPDPPPPSERPTFVLLNAGIVHRVGPHRKTVKLARALCAAGFRVARFDLSGIGDSSARRDALDFHAAALADIGEVFDDLEKRYGATRFALMGLCSGADNSFNMAVHDPRVAGAVLLDGIAYRTPRYYVHHYGERARRVRSWVTLGKKVNQQVRERLQRVLASDHAVADEPRAREAVPDYVREFEPRSVVCEKFQQIVDRGVRTYWVYTSGAELYYNYGRQFFDMFKSVDFKGCVAHDYFGESNHTFTELRSQQRLVDAVTRWATRTLA